MTTAIKEYPTTTVVAELDNLINLLEAQIPANPNSPKNQKLLSRLQKNLADYFNRVERAFPYSKLDKIYNRYVIKESLESETVAVLDPLITSFSKQFTIVMGKYLAEVYISGQAEMITWGKTKGGVPIAYEGPPVAQAIGWADKYSATLVKGLDEETQRRLAHTIAQGIEKKRGIPGLARDIKKTFGDMSTYRSRLIARTETANALSQASLDNMKAMGIEGKEWVTAGDDRVSPECRANGAQGVIARDKAFSSGATAPPQHPACRCALAPARLRTKESVEEAMTPADWKAEYKKGTPHWAKDMEPSVFAEEFVVKMKSNKTESVLEIGCGNGRDSILFAKFGAEVTSIDIVPKAIDLAKANAKKAKADINFMVANAEKLPFDDASFGAIFTLSVLHSTNLKKSLPEVARVLQPEGVAFIYIYGDTQFKDGKPKEDTIKFNDYLKTLGDLGLKILKSYTEQEDEFDSFGEKHKIFVVFLQKET